MLGKRVAVRGNSQCDPQKCKVPHIFKNSEEAIMAGKESKGERNKESQKNKGEVSS